MTAKCLQDRVALVFGAGSCAPGWGNGKATAVTLARAGAIVIAIDINPAAAEETRALIAGEGGRAEAHTCDVTQSGPVKALVDDVAARLGRIDMLHNNVGITAMGGVIDESEDSFRHVMDTNLTSAFITCKHVAPHMLARGKGSIVNVSSLAAIRYAYPYISYQASKAGVNQLTQGVALQFARQGIRANAILPGLMDTPMVHQQIAGQYASPESKIHLIGGEKGGVGKSMVSRLLAQYFIDHADPLRRLRHRPLARRAAALLHRLCVAGAGRPLRGAGRHRRKRRRGARPPGAGRPGRADACPLVHWMDESGVLDLAELGHRLHYWHVMDSGRDSVDLLARLLDRFGAAAALCAGEEPAARRRLQPAREERRARPRRGLGARVIT
jgi:NAD(P)-dependent dehydrogenase (short-subunit alcohol dehydrogenase family)